MQDCPNLVIFMDLQCFNDCYCLIQPEREKYLKIFGLGHKN